MRKGERRKQDFLKAAGELFARKGYTDTTIQDILDALGVSKGSFYHYFESKFEVLQELARAQAGEALRDYQNQAPPDPLEALNLLLVSASLLHPKALPLIHSLRALKGFEGTALLGLIQEELYTAFFSPFKGLALRLRRLDQAVYTDEASLELALRHYLAGCARLMVSTGAAAQAALLKSMKRLFETGLGLPAGCLMIKEGEILLSSLRALEG